MPVSREGEEDEQGRAEELLHGSVVDPSLRPGCRLVFTQQGLLLVEYAEEVGGRLPSCCIAGQ